MTTSQDRPFSISVAYLLSLTCTVVGVAGGSIMLRTLSGPDAQELTPAVLDNARTTALFCIVAGLLIGVCAGATNRHHRKGWVAHLSLSVISLVGVGITLVVGRGWLPLMLFMLTLLVVTALLMPKSVHWFYPHAQLRVPLREPARETDKPQQGTDKPDEANPPAQ